MQSKFNIFQKYFILISGLIFSFAYSVHSDMSGTMSQPLALGSFNAFWPYSPRFLTAWVAYKVFGAEIIQTIQFRIGLTFLCWIAIVSMLPTYLKRISCNIDFNYSMTGFSLIMFSHYCITNAFFPYYIYDIPAIVYYLIVFILLTSDNKIKIFGGCFFALVFELNREPIAIALFHAAGWWMIKDRSWPELNIKSCWEWFLQPLKCNSIEKNRLFAIACIPVTLIGMFVLRQILMYILTGHIFTEDKSHIMEDGELRIIVNFRRVFSNSSFIQNFIATGFGITFFLPVIYRHISKEMQSLVLVSIIPLSILLFENFYTELRVYNEYTPLMGCLLGSLLYLGSMRNPNSKTANLK